MTDDPRPRSQSFHDAAEDALEKVLERKLDSLFPMQEEQLQLLRENAEERRRRVQREADLAISEARWKRWRGAVAATTGLATVALQLLLWYLQHR